MGTAVTFDIISNQGYEGGIIAPGIELMRDYLHTQTALLPQLDNSQVIDHIIGKSTVEAMRIGCVLGFQGMIRKLLDSVITEMKAHEEETPIILTTGGSANLVKEGIDYPVTDVPEITLLGLAKAFQLNQ